MCATFSHTRQRQFYDGPAYTQVMSHRPKITKHCQIQCAVKFTDYGVNQVFGLHI